MSLLAALNNALTAQALLLRRQPVAALAMAKSAAEEYPNSADVQSVLGHVLMASGQPAAGRRALDEADRLARAIQPEYQQTLIDSIENPAPHP